MSKGKASGISLTNSEASAVLGMVARGDRKHDIACWFGVNQGRIAEVEDGEFGVSAAPVATLPPKGPPGLKGRRLRKSVAKAVAVLNEKGAAGVAEALGVLTDAEKKYDANEA